MAQLAPGVTSPLTPAVEWFRHQLSEGSDGLCRLMLAQLPHMAGAQLLVPPPWTEPLDNFGRRFRRHDVETTTNAFLLWLTGKGLRTLLVESDVGRKGDRYLAKLVVAYVGDRVLSWNDLRSDATVGWSALQRGAHGYPSNAFVSSLSIQEMDLEANASLTRSQCELLARSTEVMVTSVYDAEAYIALLAHHLIGSDADNYGSSAPA